MQEMGVYIDVKVYDLLFPTTHRAILEGWRRYIDEINLPEDNNIVAIIDSITSYPGVAMPWKQMVAVCKEKGIWTIVFGKYHGASILTERSLYYFRLSLPWTRASRLGQIFGGFLCRGESPDVHTPSCSFYSVFYRTDINGSILREALAFFICVKREYKYVAPIFPT